MIYDNIVNEELNASVRTITAKVELYNGYTLAATYTPTDRLKSITIDRSGEEKFFGFGVCQKLNFHLVDKDREIDNINTSSILRVYINGVNAFPEFYVSEVHRDENTNELSITAYDLLYYALEYTTAELNIEPPYDVYDYAAAVANFFGLEGIDIYLPAEDNTFWLGYPNGANIEGTEKLREILNAIADTTQTIYYISHDNFLVFKRLSNDTPAAIMIDKSKYFKLESKTNRRLGTITHTTQLGDNFTASTDATGTTQYVRDNPFWELREDLPNLVDAAIAAIGGLTINQFNCSWRGNHLVEIGDKLVLEAKDGGLVESFLLNDTIQYDGSLKQTTKWNYTDNDTETAANPTNIGDLAKYTYAKVDKVNKQVDIVVSDIETQGQEISTLQLTTNNITASVSDINKDVGELSNKVEAAITGEDIKIVIQEELADGVGSVITATGFTFNDEGLNISKSGSEMTTLITEDGMSVSRGKKEVLTAGNAGVKAEDLHATTFLIIGKNSRLEDYDSGRRTGCFWIG